MSEGSLEGAGEPSPGLLLVEPLASQRGGHQAQSLRLLAAAGSGAGRPVVVVAVHGVDDAIRAALEPLGARILVGPFRRLGATALMLLCARALNTGFASLQPRMPTRTFPYQLRLFADGLVEAASLRLGREALGAQRAVTAVVLTAGVTLHASVNALAGVPHVRYLHDLSRDEPRSVRAAEHLFRRALGRTWIFCTTAAVQEALQRHYPEVRSLVQPYALDDPGARIEPTMRARARSELALPGDGAVVGSLVGGWWMVKDMGTVAEALPRVTRPFTLLVAGYRMDRRILDAIARGHRGELRVIDRQLTSDELGQVYAASDFTIVSRMPGGKESGVALDAVSRGVPLVISNHDDELSRKLDDRPWARIFDRGDPESLARALSEVCADPLPPPPADAGATLGMLRADEMLGAFDRAAREID